MALSKSRQKILDGMIKKMKTDKVEWSKIEATVKRYVKKYSGEKSPSTLNLEKAIRMAIKDGSPPEIIETLRAMHPSYTDEQKQQIREGASLISADKLDPGDRYNILGMPMPAPLASAFETVFPYASRATKKGASDERVGAGAYADVSSGLGRAAVGLAESGTDLLLNTLTGATSGRSLGENIADIDRENIVTKTLSAPGTVESLAVGGILGQGIKAAAPALKNIPAVSNILSKTPLQPLADVISKGASKLPFMGKSGIVTPGIEASIGQRIAPMATRGAISSVPSALTTQAADYSQTGEFDMGEAGLEVAAGAVLDPATELLGRQALKAGKSLAKTFFQNVSDRSGDMLDFVQLEELKEGASKYLGKGSIKGYKSSKLNTLRDFGKQSKDMTDEMLHQLDNFHELHLADPGNRAYEALQDLDLINIKPLRDQMYSEKSRLAPANMKWYIEEGKGEFAGGKIPIGYRFGIPGLDKKLERIDGLIMNTVSPAGLIEANDLIDVKVVKNNLVAKKKIPEGWKDRYEDGGVPFGHKFGDQKIDSYNRKIDELVLQFGPANGTLEQEEAQRLLRMAITAGDDLPPDLVNKAFRKKESIDKKADYWPVERVNNLVNQNTNLGDKSKIEVLNNVLLDGSARTSKDELMHPIQMVDLRNALDEEVKHNVTEYGSMNAINKRLRHMMKVDLENASIRSGNKAYIPAMRELNDKLEAKEQLMDLMNSNTDWGGAERYERFLLSLANKNKISRNIFVSKLERLMGVKIKEKANLLKMASEYADNLPVLNDMRTGARTMATTLFKETPLKFAGALTLGPKGAAVAHGLMNKATPAVQKGVTAARQFAHPAISNIYQREQ
jgi:hypothetical protein